jgi:hypothetical protein
MFGILIGLLSAGLLDFFAEGYEETTFIILKSQKNQL